MNRTSTPPTRYNSFVMTTKTRKLAVLRTLQTKADAIRQELAISPPGTVFYQNWLNGADDEMVIVEADGFGHATMRVVEGNYPLDYLAISEKMFESEQDAQDAADAVVEGALSLDPA